MLLSSLTGTSTIKAHFWNLSAYTAGVLIGDWVDLDDHVDFEGFQEAVKRVTMGAEEVLMGDHESDFGVSFPEFVGLESLWAVHESLCEVSEYEREAFADYLGYVGGMDYLDEAVRTWRDHYCGQFDSIESYAWSFAEDIYPDLANVPPGFRVQVDTLAWECDHWISDNGHVFSA